ncbi:MAG: hypothetical protein C0598_00595 [Marinilabiliales bacterium]|nr:MAG: hypothetical protein C0598_00595 [Marinilabiliales bacterium]
MTMIDLKNNIKRMKDIMNFTYQSLITKVSEQKKTDLNFLVIPNYQENRLFNRKTNHKKYNSIA